MANASLQNRDETSLANCVSATTSLSCRIEIYHAISEWIRFADAKAAVVLTVGAALASFLVPTVKNLVPQPGQAMTAMHVFAMALLFIYLAMFVTSSANAFLCINPLRTRRGHPSLDYCELFHPVAVANKYAMHQVSKFIQDNDEANEEVMHRQVQSAFLLDSHISARKYARVTASIRWFTASSAFGFAYYLAAQF